MPWDAGLVSAIENDMTYFKYENVGGGGGAVNISIFILMAGKMGSEER